MLSSSFTQVSFRFLVELLLSSLSYLHAQML